MKKLLLASTLLLNACYNPNTLVFHSTAFDAEKAITTYIEHDVSVHYIVEENGNVILLTPEEEQAAHAGQSYWRGYDRINPRSIGIEILQPTLGQSKFSEKQIEAVIELSKKIIKKYNIKPTMIVGHSDIAPRRKPDPGKCFPWKKLSEEEIGIWYYLPDAKKVADISVEEMLFAIGYDTKDLAAAQYAFARRYMPELVEINDVIYTIENPYPKNFDASNNKKFVEILKAVYFRYSQPQCFR